MSLTTSLAIQNLYNYFYDTHLTHDNGYLIDKSPLDPKVGYAELFVRKDKSYLLTIYSDSSFCCETLGFGSLVRLVQYTAIHIFRLLRVCGVFSDSKVASNDLAIRSYQFLKAQNRDIGVYTDKPNFARLKTSIPPGVSAGNDEFFDIDDDTDDNKLIKSEKEESAEAFLDRISFHFEFWRSHCGTFPLGIKVK